MRFLSLQQILIIYDRIIAQSGGGFGIRDLGALETAVAQPRMSFAGEDLYPTLVDKAAALGHSIIQNHPFVDGNKRTGHAAMELFLYVNGYEIDCSIDEQEAFVLSIASGKASRQDIAVWLSRHVIQRA